MDERQDDPRKLYDLEFPAPAVYGADGDGPVLIHALEGYADAGHAVALAATHLREALDSELVATFNTDELIDYRSRRPMISFSGVEFDGIDMHKLTVHAVRDNAGVPFLLLDGPEPDLRWEQFTTAITALAERFGVSQVVGLNSIPMAVPHTRPASITAHGNDSDALGDLNRWGNPMKLPASASMLLELRLGQAGYRTAGLSAHVPHYLAQANYPGASAALIQAIGKVAGLELPVAALENAAEQMREQIDGEVASNAEVAAVVTSLENQYDAYMRAKNEQASLLAADQDVPSGDELGAEFERFLAEHAAEFDGLGDGAFPEPDDESDTGPDDTQGRDPS
ncbi:MULTISPECIES: proteasome assembly chaperone family protein [Gordonia]|uniref:PAC2 family protein n=1 Tax=Gordonia cholesterolivorans TaxID=559625 RepID=A0ABN3HAH7_9ACTN|nr:PAC2 family protein [Gordonia sihwensis]KJR02750.1 proteasome protein [Gordonia sihwensis]MBY4569724.1 proteasome protein [Gordonia sihwensis]